MLTEKDRRIVVVGGGFAGTAVARVLETQLDESWDIYLLTRSNVMTYNPLLPEVVGGALLPGHVAAPIRLMLSRARIRMVTVGQIDTNQRTVTYSGVVHGTLRYDHLVLAMGLAANLNAVPGMARHALPLKTLGDALHLRNTILRRLEEATLTTDAARRRSLLTFVVIGGGFSGVETAGEIADLVGSAYRHYRNIARDDPHVVLLHSGPRLLPEIAPQLGKYAQHMLERRGVEVRLGARAERLDADSVALRDGEIIGGATLVSTVGTMPHEFVNTSQFPVDRGRILTDPDMRVRGSTDVWAVGDCARIRNAYDHLDCPPTAQFAVRQAKSAAANIIATVQGKPVRDFSYRPMGQLAAIGHRRAVAEIFGIRIHGFVGWLLWRALYLSKIPTMAAKVRVHFEWTWAMFFARDPGCLEFERTRLPEQDAAEAASPELATLVQQLDTRL
ncbi:MAG: NAD(P)/FAD-dependent oxidoreductase [Pseudomonadales bacterium]